MKKRREIANPARQDQIIASQIVAPAVLNGDGVPQLAPANPSVAAVNVPQLLGVRLDLCCVCEMLVRVLCTACVTSFISFLGQFRRDIAPARGAPPSLLLLLEANRHQPSRGTLTISWPISPKFNSKIRATSVLLIKTFFDFTLRFLTILLHRAKKAEAAALAAQGQLLQSQINAMQFIMSLPSSSFQHQAITQMQAGLLRSTAVQPASAAPAPDVAAVVVSSDDEEPVRECTICHEPILPNTPVMITPCNHTFHFQCLTPWLRRSSSCPYCRANLEEQIIVHDD